jgi:hypothetical protein
MIEIYARGACIVVLLLLCLQVTIHAFHQVDCTIRGRR